MIKNVPLFLIILALVGCNSSLIKSDQRYIKNELNRVLSSNETSGRITLENESEWDQVIFLEPYSPYKEVFHNLDLSENSLEKIRSDIGTYESGHIYLIKEKKIICKYFGHRFLVKDGYILVIKPENREIEFKLRDGILELVQYEKVEDTF